MTMDALKGRIDDGTAVVGIMGLGYVGLPLAMAFAARFQVHGFDVDGNNIAGLRKGETRIQDVSAGELGAVLGKSFHPTSEGAELAKCDFIIICVPTPLRPDRTPDMTYVESASGIVRDILHEGQFIILESTTYPGTTDEVMVPILEESGLKACRDFGVAYSPERIDPGNPDFHVTNTPKLVGGLDPACTDIAAALYGSVIEAGIVKVRDCRTAEAAKLLENIYRHVNIALINEMSLIFGRLGVDTWEAIRAASTKPYGFKAFYPGPGVGGHCIPIDPFYLSYQSKRYGFIPRFIELSGEINEYMKHYTVHLVEQGLKRAGVPTKGARIAICGLAYKDDSNDHRESPAVKIIKLIENHGGIVVVHDPHVEHMKIDGKLHNSTATLEEALKGADCAVFTVKHREFRDRDLRDLVKGMRHRVVVDCKDIFGGEGLEGIDYHGIGKRG